MAQYIKLKENLANLQALSFIGRVNLKKTSKIDFQIYFYLGQIIWATNTATTNRAFQLGVETSCPHIDLGKISLVNPSQVDNWHYNTIGFLYQKKIILKEQVRSLIENQIQDVLFDILQVEEREQLHYEIEVLSTTSLSESGVKLSPIRCEVDLAIAYAEQQLEAWNSNEFTGLSPNLVPKIEQLQLIELDLKNNQNYKHIEKIIEQIDGQNNLREIAAKVRLPLVQTVYYIEPYIRKGAIDLKEIPDRAIYTEYNRCLSLTIDRNLAIEDNTIPANNKRKVVASIDDSNQMILLMKEIVERADYSFIGIDNPLQAIPSAIEHLPELFFIDANMPTMNGYELYQQIRRIPELQDKPIVFISAYERFLYEIQTKISHHQQVYYLNKPIEPIALIAIIKRLLSGKGRELNPMLNDVIPMLLGNS
jgi:two-component system, chemotaxis family, response regulator PixG